MTAYLNVREAAERLGITVNAFRLRLDRGKLGIPTHYLPGATSRAQKRWLASDIDKLATKQES